MRISDWSSDVCSSDLGGWPGYKVRASTDRETWRQVETTYANGVLEWRWPGGAPLVWFAYFAPYPVERHNQLIADYAARPGFAHRELGTSLDGRSIDYLTTDRKSTRLNSSH